MPRQFLTRSKTSVLHFICNYLQSFFIISIIFDLCLIVDFCYAESTILQNFILLYICATSWTIFMKYSTPLHRSKCFTITSPQFAACFKTNGRKNSRNKDAVPSIEYTGIDVRKFIANNFRRRTWEPSQSHARTRLEKPKRPPFNAPRNKKQTTR